MPRIAYETKNFRPATLEIISRANTIAQQYAAQGYGLTLRQLYYRFVANGWIENTQRSYKNLGSIVNDARMAGLFDWFHLDDRTRYLRSHPSWDSPSSIMQAGASQYQRDLWEVTDQEYRPEVWVEKDALIDVVERACRTFRVPSFSCRGYVSQSEMWRAGRRMRDHRINGRTPVVIHLGDHDPSGIDMTRDIEDRLMTFAGCYVEVRRIALTMNQIQEYDPPPNPAKLTDARAQGYVDRFGYESWELDALPPEILAELIADTVDDYVDLDSWEQGHAEDVDEQRRMRAVAEQWDSIVRNWDAVQNALD